VGNVLRERMLRTNAARIDRAGFAGLRECVIAGIKVLAFLEMLG
jgi:hypothetical protein